MQQFSKKYVGVVAEFCPDGRILPKYVEWEDGQKFVIDRILDIRQAPSLKVGGAGIRYYVRIGGKETYLWYEDGLWFVESKAGRGA